jgi:hypothetical protein
MKKQTEQPHSIRQVEAAEANSPGVRVYEPTPEEIAAECARIREGWGPNEAARR